MVDVVYKVKADHTLNLEEHHAAKSCLLISLMFSYVTSSLLSLALPEGQVFFYLLIACKIINSCYTLLWDLKMDWGLFDRNAGENTLLREEIVYPQKVRIHILLVFMFYYLNIFKENRPLHGIHTVVLLICVLSSNRLTTTVL